jgi:hypothetical protein
VIYSGPGGSIVSESHQQIVHDALVMENEAADGIEAAQVEQQSGRSTLSLGLLREAIEKERASLDLLEQGVETLYQSLQQRRQALDQQTEILDQVISQLTQTRQLTQRSG